MKAVVICIEGYWKDTRQQFEHRCVVMPMGATDSIRDEVLHEVGDDNIFYVFESGEPIIGEHLDFVVTSYSPVKDVIVYERISSKG